MSALLKERPPMPKYEDTGDPVLAERVRARRKSLGWTQRQLAEAMEPPMSQRWVSGIEGVEFGANTEMMRALAAALRTTTAYLYGESDSPETPEDRLRRIGIAPGNLSEITDEDLTVLLAGLAEEFQKRSLRPRTSRGEGEHPNGDEGQSPRAARG